MQFGREKKRGFANAADMETNANREKGRKIIPIRDIGGLNIEN